MFFMIYLDSNFVQDWREDKGEDEEDESDSRGRKEEEGRADRAVDGSLKRRTNERPTDSLTHSLTSPNVVEISWKSIIGKTFGVHK